MLVQSQDSYSQEESMFCREKHALISNVLWTVPVLLVKNFSNHLPGCGSAITISALTHSLLSGLDSQRWGERVSRLICRARLSAMLALLNNTIHTHRAAMDDIVFHTHEVVRRKDQWKFRFRVPERFSRLRFVHAGVQGVIVYDLYNLNLSIKPYWILWRTAHDLERNKRVTIKKVACNINTENSGRRAYEDLSKLASLKHPNVRKFCVFRKG